MVLYAIKIRQTINPKKSLQRIFQTSQTQMKKKFYGEMNETYTRTD